MSAPENPTPPAHLVQLSARQFRKEARERFLAGRKAETQYTRQLLGIPRHIDKLVRGMAPGGVLTQAQLSDLVGILTRYSDILRPWSESVAWRMIQDVAKRDAAAWRAHGQMIGRALKLEIENAPTGVAMRKLLAARVDEITSIPRDAAQRLLHLTAEAQLKGARASEIAAEILKSGEVSASSAKMLARTGVSTTATNLTRARAEYVGSTHYIWRTSRDGDVRPSHRLMEGKPVAWNDPPELDGYRAHAGEFANCRCGPEVVLPENPAGSKIMLALQAAQQNQ